MPRNHQHQIEGLPRHLRKHLLMQKQAVAAALRLICRYFRGYKVLDKLDRSDEEEKLEGFYSVREPEAGNWVAGGVFSIVLRVGAHMGIQHISTVALGVKEEKAHICELLRLANND